MRGGRGGSGGSRRDDELRRDLDDEIEAHVAMRADDLVAEGMDPEEARREAWRRFGDQDAARRALLAQARRRERRRRRVALAQAVGRDVAHALRRMGRAPGFSLFAASVFALGVGASTATFSLVDNVLLRPLPYPAPGELVALGSRAEHGEPFYRVSMGNWVDLRSSGAIASTALFADGEVTVTGEGEPFRVPAATVTGAFFETLRPRMVAGHPFEEADGQEERNVVVLGEPFWRDVMGGAPIDGRSLELDGRRYRVIGVLARGWALPADAALWLPSAWRPAVGGMRNNINWRAVARLAPGVSAEAARSELSEVAAGIRARDPAGVYAWGVGLQPLREQVAGDARGVLRILMASVLFVLLAACANLAGLGLARGRRRAREMATRLALGARRGQLLRQLLVEQLLLALVGGGAGLLLAWAASGAVLRAVADLVPAGATISFDARVAAFGVGAALLAGLLTGLVPALRTARTGAWGVRGAVSGGRGLPGAIMVGAETALAVTLLVGGGLLLRSFLATTSRELGFDPTGVLTVDVALSAPGYGDPERSLSYWERLLDRQRAIPGVTGVAIATGIPTAQAGASFIEVEGDDRPNDGAGYRVVSDDYFEVLGVPLLAGRSFDGTDDAGTERVGVVSASFARTFWPEGSAIGKRFKAPSMEAYFNGGEADWIRIVGVVGEIRQGGFEYDARPGVFVLYRQMPAFTRAMSAVVKLRPGAPAGTAEALAAAARAVDPALAVRVRSLAGRVRGVLSGRRLTLTIVGTFAAAGLLLVCLGVYGLIAFAVQERTREIAVRAALGLDRGGILALMLGSALRVAVLGIAAGVLAALAFTRLMDSVVVGVGTTDPLTYGVAGALLLLVALAAALVPALRATRLDPIEALRTE